MQCTIKAEFPDAEAVKAAIKAVSHERHAGGRSSAKVASSGRTLAITIEARDAVALRAAANAYLRALAVFEGLEKGGIT
jgi:tRNA threonylcarbamoyladenosine modification (KEOPS) complex  Pcc1 subunit